MPDGGDRAETDRDRDREEEKERGPGHDLELQQPESSPERKTTRGPNEETENKRDRVHASETETETEKERARAPMSAPAAGLAAAAVPSHSPVDAPETRETDRETEPETERETENDKASREAEAERDRASMKRKDTRSALAKKLGWGSPKRRRKQTQRVGHRETQRETERRPEPKALTPEELEREAQRAAERDRERREREDAALAQALQEKLGGGMYGGRKSRKPQVFDPVAEAARPQLARTERQRETERGTERGTERETLREETEICCDQCHAWYAIRATHTEAHRDTETGTWICGVCKGTHTALAPSPSSSLPLCEQKRPSPPPGPPPTRRPPKERPTEKVQKEHRERNVERESPGTTNLPELTSQLDTEGASRETTQSLQLVEASAVSETETDTDRHRETETDTETEAARQTEVAEDAERARVAAIIAASTAAIQRQWREKKQKEAERDLPKQNDAVVQRDTETEVETEAEREAERKAEREPPAQAAVTYLQASGDGMQTTDSDRKRNTERDRERSTETNIAPQPAAHSLVIERHREAQSDVTTLQIVEATAVVEPQTHTETERDADRETDRETQREFVVGSSVTMTFEEPDGTLRDWPGTVEEIESSGRLRVSFADGTVESGVDPADPDLHTEERQRDRERESAIERDTERLRLRQSGRRLYGKQGKSGAPEENRERQREECFQECSGATQGNTEAAAEAATEEPETAASEWTAEESDHLRRLVEQQGTGRWQAKALALGTLRSPGAVAQHYFSLCLSVSSLSEQSDDETPAVDHNEMRRETRGEKQREENNRGTFWTADEDAQLTRLVQQHGAGDWPTKSQMFSTPRTSASLRLRWKAIQERRSSDEYAGRLPADGMEDTGSGSESDTELDTELDRELDELTNTGDDVPLDVLESAILRRSTLTAWCVREDFNQLVEGCLVRVAELRTEGHGGAERGYYTGLVTGAFEFRQPYMVSGVSTAKGLLLQRTDGPKETGRERQRETVRLNLISNLVPSQQELLCISQKLTGTASDTPGGTEKSTQSLCLTVCTRAQELSRNLFTQAAAKEVSRAKALITKWNSIGNTKRLREAVALHTKLIKAFEASDWQTMQSS
eukprot:COSAG03_NODE_1378_length_4208_cov_6.583110_1_plen_1096_part_01